jgi:hypothetical protein
MSAGRGGLSGLLRWYPPAWRARYGDELVALMEDSLDGGRPSPRFRWSVAVAGLRQRARALDALGRRGGPADRVRDGALVVLCAWTAFVLAGASFAKQAEHFGSSLPPSQVGLPTAAMTTVMVAAMAGAALVALGAVAVLPAFVRFLRAGGWADLRRPVLAASALSVAVVGATVGLAGWAHSLSFARRNGADAAYSAAFLAWAAGVAVALALWTAVAVRAGRRIDTRRGILGLEALLAAGVALAMAVMTAATAVWWGALSVDAPWFLRGTDPGTSPSPLEPRLALTMILMVAATAVAARGVTRAGRSWSRLGAA